MGSSFYENQKRKHEAVSRRIAHLLRKRDERWTAASAAQKEAIVRHVDRMAADLECDRTLSRTFLHCDMDMFYAAVELQRQPSLRGQCFAVGHGVLLTASYEARRHGVRSGMAEFVARALCPTLIVVPSHFDAYRQASEAVMRVLRTYDARLYSRSWDEAYLDITPYLRTHHSTPRAVAEQLRADVEQATGLTVSVGIAPNLLLAKIASDRAKPNGVCEVAPDRDAVLAFVRPLAVRQVPGIGVVTERVLAAMQVTTCADLWTRRAELSVCLDAFRTLLAATLGLGPTRVTQPARDERKSVGRESTFAPTSDPAQLHARLRQACEQVARDLRRLEFRGRTVTLVGKHDTFERFTRAKAVPRGAATFDELYDTVYTLLEQERQSFPGSLTLRLLGVRVSSLMDTRAARTGVLATWLRTPTSRTNDDDWHALSSFECPICGEAQRVSHAAKLAQINAHIDACLQSSVAPPSRRERRRAAQPTIDTFFR